MKKILIATLVVLTTMAFGVAAKKEVKAAAVPTASVTAAATVKVEKKMKHVKHVKAVVVTANATTKAK